MNMQSENTNTLLKEKFLNKNSFKNDISKSWVMSKVNSAINKNDQLLSDSIEVNLPHHWQEENNFQNHTGSVIYSKTIKIDREVNSRYFILFEGIFYKHTLFINNEHIGTNESYFSAFEYEIPKHLLDDELNIKIEVESKNEINLKSKKYVTGIFGHWDCQEPEFNLGGIWKHVYIVKKGNVSIKNALLKTEKITTQKSHQHNCECKLTLDLNTFLKEQLKLKITCEPENFTGKTKIINKEITVNSSPNEKLELNFNFDDIKLWFPYELGFPHTYRILIELHDSSGLSDSVSFSYGFRILHWKDWRFSINGKSIYAKGLNVGPLRYRIAHVNPNEWENEFINLRKLNCNMLRVHGHVQIKEFYEYADKYGILIFQDFPLQWLYSKKIKDTAIKQMKDMVSGLYNHPSIVLWSCHNEPYYIGQAEDLDKSNITDVWRFLFYNYNKVVLDRKLRKAAKSIDDTRFINRASCIYSIVGFRGSDIHTYWGWYFSNVNLLNTIKRISKRNFKFISEFGTQSIPNYDNAIKFMNKNLNNVDWQKLKHEHNCQPRLLQKYIPISEDDTLKTYIDRTQDYQCFFTQYYIDLIRTLKRKPGKGMIAFKYKSCHPGIDWSIVDYWGGKKKAFTTIRRGFQSVYPFAYLNKNNLFQKGNNLIKFYVTNDLPNRIEDLKITVRIKINNEKIFLKTFKISLPHYSKSIKFASYKLSKLKKGDKCDILLIAETENKVYKNRYSFNGV